MARVGEILPLRLHRAADIRQLNLGSRYRGQAVFLYRNLPTFRYWVLPLTYDLL